MPMYSDRPSPTLQPPKHKSGRYTPTYGDKRTQAWFAFLPVTIENNTKWLQFVAIEQKYIHSEWTNIKFIDC